MQLFNQCSAWLIDNVLWGTHTFVVLLGVGLLFTVWSKFVQFRALTHGVALIRGKYTLQSDPGAISHFQALSTALSGTVGLGNIGGVAMAISIGGPGALFWMWMTGFFGMAIKAVEVTLSMLYRDTSNPDDPHGGAMWVIKRGWGDRHGGWAQPVAWAIGALFSLTLLIAAFTGGNMFQAWNVGDITNSYFGVAPWLSGVIMAVVTALVILGGIKRIGDVTGLLTPMMCGIYLAAGLVVLVVESAQVPRLLWTVVQEAFSPTEAQGAFLGATTWFGITTGLRRALFSNEAGQGSSPIAHSAAKTHEPVSEGIVAGLEPFVDTCLVCTLTALVILATGTWNRGADGTFGAEVRLAAPADQGSGSAWHIVASTDVALLPELPQPDRWDVGNAFFLLAEVPQDDADTGTKLKRVTGEIVADAQQTSGMAIAWKECPTGAKLISQEVFRDLKAAALTGLAFDRSVPGLGKWMVTLTCWLFAVSTLISWSYYGEQAMVYLFGARSVPWYKLAYCLSTVVATLPGFITTDVELGNLSDIGTGCMLFANAPIIVLMGHRAIAAFGDYFRRLDAGEIRPRD